MNEEPQVPEADGNPDITEAVEALTDSVEEEELEEGYDGQVRDLILMGDPVLREKSDPLPEVTEEAKQLAADLTATMLEYGGIGISAPQIGQLWRVIVILDNQGDEAPGSIRVRSMYNPEIVDAEGEHSMLEGCLSIPGARVAVARFDRIIVEYLDLDGEPRREGFTGSQAAVVQHEIDHLDGKLFLDHLSQFQRSRAVKSHRKVMKKAYRQAKRDYS